jgi:hypothetical protein
MQVSVVERPRVSFLCSVELFHEVLVRDPPLHEDFLLT